MNTKLNKSNEKILQQQIQIENDTKIIAALKTDQLSLNFNTDKILMSSCINKPN